MRSMSHVKRGSSFAFLVLGLISSAAWGLDVPDAGTTMQELRQPAPPPKPSPGFNVEEQQAPAATADESAQVLVKQLQIVGQTRYSEAELLALTGFVPNMRLTMAQLQQMAHKIQVHYRTHGYFLARVYLPVQESSEGSVTIRVIEAHYGKFDVRNRSALTASTVGHVLRGLHAGDVITLSNLERGIFLLNDMPGVTVKSTLAPGTAIGSSDLVIEVDDSRRISGSLDADNNGNRFTGANRLGARVSLNNPTGLGEQISLQAQNAFGGGLTTGRATYQVPIMDGQIGVAYAATDYSLKEELAVLDAHGTAETTSLYASYPFVRSRKLNLSGRIDVERRDLKDRIDTTATNTDKQSHLWMLSLNGDSLDALCGGGQNTFDISYSGGHLDILTPAALAIDKLTARTKGNFGKLGFNAARLQALNESTSLYAMVSGQLASKNLDSSEKFILGGAHGVRAYPLGEAPGDEGYLVNLEIRRLLPKPVSLPGDLQLVGFLDGGSVKLNKKTWVASQRNRNLSGAGIGLNWSKKDDFTVKVEYAWKLGDEKATADRDRSGRLWVQGVKYF